MGNTNLEIMERLVADVEVLDLEMQSELVELGDYEDDLIG